jgi:hypothetical protein
MRARRRLKIKTNPADAIGKEGIQLLCQLIRLVSSLPGQQRRPVARSVVPDRQTTGCMSCFRWAFRFKNQAPDTRSHGCLKSGFIKVLHDPSDSSDSEYLETKPVVTAAPKVIDGVVVAQVLNGGRGLAR